MALTFFPDAVRFAEMTTEDRDALIDKWGLMILNGTTDRAEIKRRDSTWSALLTADDHQDAYDAFILGNAHSGPDNPNYPVLFQAITDNHVSIFMKEAIDTAAITIASGDKVQRIQGKDADTVTVPVDITCNKDDVTFEQLHIDSKKLRIGATGTAPNGDTVRDCLVTGDGVIEFGDGTNNGGFRHTLESIRALNHTTGVGAAPIILRGGSNEVTIQTLHATGGAGTNLIRFDMGSTGSVVRPLIRDVLLQDGSSLTGYAIGVIQSGAATVDDVIIDNPRLFSIPEGGIDLFGSRNTIYGGRLLAGSALTSGKRLIRLNTFGGINIDSRVIGATLQGFTGTDVLFECAAADADADGLVLLGVQGRLGTILGSQNARWLECDFAGLTIDFQSKTGIVVIGGDMTSATLQNANADLVFRGVKGQDDRGDIVHGTGSIRLNDNIELELGTGGDVEMSYDGTDMIINPKAVGSGELQLQGDLRLKDATPNIAFEDTGQASPAGKFNMVSTIDLLVISGRNAADNGFENIMIIQRVADGGAVFFDNAINVDTINERDSAAGVTIDSVLIKDGNVDGVTVDTHAHDGSGTGAPAVPATNVTYVPAVLADWDSSADPGDTDDALDQLAARLTALEP